MFFISNQMSPYYKSDVFKKIIDNIGRTRFEFKQSEGRLKLVTRGVDSLDKALGNLRIFS